VSVTTDVVMQLSRSFKGALAATRRLRGRETHCPGELSNAQYGLLFGLLDQDEQPLRELALLADVSPATATEMLEGLAAAGYVTRVRSEHDRRVVLTSLTTRGRALIEERRQRYEPRWRAALQEFSDEELQSAAAVLDRIRGLFEELAEERLISRS
jgi:MarR family transcriptional regulator, organic hydroperoxide resistance regulator